MTDSHAERHPCRDLLPFYLNQTLSPTVRRQVAAHLETCVECQQAMGEWSRLAQGVQQDMVQYAPSLPDGLPPLSPLVFISQPLRPSLGHAARSAWNLVWAQRVFLGRSLSIPALGVLIILGILVPLLIQANAQEWMAQEWTLILPEWGVIPLFTLVPVVAALLTALLYAVEDDDAYEMIASLPTPLTTLVFARLTLALGSLTILAVLGSVLVALLGGGGLLQLVAAWLAPMLWLSALTTLLSIAWRPRPAAGIALVIWGMLVILLARELNGSPFDGITLRLLLQPGWELAAGQLLFAGLLLMISWLWLRVGHFSLRRGLH